LKGVVKKTVSPASHLFKGLC